MTGQGRSDGNDAPPHGDVVSTQQAAQSLQINTPGEARFVREKPLRRGWHRSGRPFADRRRVSSSAINLITSLSDLRVVRLIRGAIAQDPQGVPGPLGTVVRPRVAQEGGLAGIEPAPRILPRDTIEPAPHIEPRRVIRPTPRVIESTIHLPPMCPTSGKSGDSNVLPPPWKQPVWEIPIPPPAPIKLTQYHPDIRHKGTLIDNFA